MGNGRKKVQMKKKKTVRQYLNKLDKGKAIKVNNDNAKIAVDISYERLKKDGYIDSVTGYIN